MDGLPQSALPNFSLIRPAPLRPAPSLVCAPAALSPLQALDRDLGDAALECSGYADAHITAEASEDAAWALGELRKAVRILRRIAPLADAAMGAADAETDMVSSDDMARGLRRWALDLAANAGVALPGGEGA